MYICHVCCVRISLVQPSTLLEQIILYSNKSNVLLTELRSQVGWSMQYFETEFSSFKISVILSLIMIFMCSGVMYLGENDVCVWCYFECISTSGNSNRGGNRTKDLWYAIPMLTW